jgi:hypothetical protein
LGEGNPVSLDSCHIPDVRHGVSVCGTESPAIKSLDHFAGLRIGVRPRAGTGGTYVPEIFKILGITADIASEDRTNGLADGRR